jgi:hypothetical protein
MPSQLFNCTFAEGNNKLGVASLFVDCTFINESVHGYAISEPSTDSQDTLEFLNCTFRNAMLALQWKKYGQNVVVRVEGSTFEYMKGGKFLGAFIEVAFGLKQIELINCAFSLDPQVSRVPKVAYLDNISHFVLTGSRSNEAQETIFGCRKNCDATVLTMANNDLKYAKGLGVARQ